MEDLGEWKADCLILRVIGKSWRIVSGLASNMFHLDLLCYLYEEGLFRHFLFFSSFTYSPNGKQTQTQEMNSKLLSQSFVTLKLTQH